MQRINQKVAFDTLMPLIEEKLNEDGLVRIPAMGISMYPLFRHKKDLVFLEKVELETIKKYDMILYRRVNGQYVLHRIVGSDRGGYWLRGDNQLYNEYPVLQSQIIAKVTGFSRNGKDITCKNLLYRCYVVCWVRTVWIRKCYTKCLNVMYLIKNKMVKIIKKR